MTANKFKIKVGKKDQDIRIPLQLTFEETGRGDLIKEYEDDVLRKLINPTKDFEVTRYNHAGYNCGGTYISELPILNSKIGYSFAFENAGVWNDAYNVGNMWTNLEIFRKSESLRNSFFKLDLYDTPYRRNQQLYISLIITPFSGQEKVLTVAYPDGTTSSEFLKVPNFIFGANTNDVKENFYLYWLKEIVPDLDIFDFYMTAKFFNGRTGQIKKFTVLPQNIGGGGMKYTLPESFFYYHVQLDHATKSYIIKRIPNGLGLPPFANEERIGLIGAPTCGTADSPVVWFEYTNPL